MSALEKLKLIWTKVYLWVALACVLVLMVVFFWRRKTPTGTPTPGEVDVLAKAAAGLRKQMAKADNDAQIKVIRAETKEQAVKEQVEHIEKMDDELEKAKRLVELRKQQTGKS